MFTRAPINAQHILSSVQSAIHSISIGAIVVMALIALFLLRSITHRPKRRKDAANESEATQERVTKKQGKPLVRRFVRWAGTNLGLAIVYPLGSRLAAKRIEVIESAYGVMAAAIDQAGHRRSKAVCLPGLIRARWIVKCDGCGQFFAFKEARSLVNSDEHSLKILSGFALEKGVVRATACKARFVEGTPARQPAAAAQTLGVVPAQPAAASSTTVARVNAPPHMHQKTS